MDGKPTMGRQEIDHSLFSSAVISSVDYLSHLRFDPCHPEVLLSYLRTLEVTLLGVVAGSEIGIECCDWLSEAIGLPTNGMSGSEARRDKYIMQETIKAHGLRSIRQIRATHYDQIEHFASIQSFPLIVKPLRSAGSDHIFKCRSKSDLRRAFDSIMNHKNAFGDMNQAVVVQEFIEGTEYIVDTVSRDGVHKVVALWAYDKRSHQGQDFVYYGMSSLSGTSEVGRQLASYTVGVLDAVGIRHGAGHAEVIMTKDGPCLVEVGARPQGCEGNQIRD